MAWSGKKWGAGDQWAVERWSGNRWGGSRQLTPRMVPGCMWEYDLYNWGTLFQDKNGTIPVTAYGQPVGLNLDLSGNGIGSNGSKRVNLFNYTEDCSAEVWLKQLASVTPNSVIAPNGTLTGDTINMTSIYSHIRSTITVTPSTSYTFTFYVLRGTATNLKYSVYNVTNASELVVPFSYYQQTSASEWVKITIAFTTPSNCLSIGLYPIRDSSAIGTVHIWGADLRKTTDATVLPSYQKINADWPSTIPGNHRFSESAARPTLELSSSGKPCLKYNGVGQYMQTNPFAWGSDEVCVIMGVRTLTTDGVQMFVELSTNSNHNPGAFDIFLWLSRSFFADSVYYGGRISRVNSFPYVAPYTGVITSIMKISSDTNKMIVNGTQEGSSLEDQGAGNYGTYDLYFGSRAGTLYFLNGYEFSSCGFNKIPTDAQFAVLNRYINNKTGAY